MISGDGNSGAGSGDGQQETKVLTDLSNADYHGNRTHLSSSKLKLLLEDPQKFYQEFVLGQKEAEKPKPHFLVGSYFHSLVLEPEKVEQEYAFWTGWQKRGKEFEEFSAANPGKTILSAAQKNAGEMLARAIPSDPRCVDLLKSGIAEQSVFSVLDDVPVKVRFDKVCHERAYIIDLKSTGLPTGVEFFAEAVANYGYDLSAALYAMVAEQVFGRPYEFYFVVASKDDVGVAPYKLSKRTREAGTKKVFEALQFYKQCLQTGTWELPKKPNKSNNLDEIEEV